MKEMLETLLDTLRAGSAAELVTIIEREGSSPRGVGAFMIVRLDGTAGTVGGGAVEYRATLDARALLEQRASGTREYLLHPNEAADLGMICGGRVRMLFRFFDATEDDIGLLERLLGWMRDGTEAYLICRIGEGGAERSKGVLRGELETLPEACEALDELPLTRPTLTDGEPQLFVEPLVNAPRAIVFGGGHVSQQLVPLLSFIGFRAWVVEDRAEFADKSLFPAAERVVQCPFDRVLDAVTITDGDHVVVMTRGHQADYTILRQALTTKASYIGCIGSRSKVAITRGRLLADGFSEREIDRVHAPIGLAIGAEAPAEIAVSIAAELIAHRARPGEGEPAR